MAHYVVSDLHGEDVLFHKMLDKIEFSDADTLFVIGDVVDRGPGGISLLQEILRTPNMTLIMGNHDYMMLRYFSLDVTDLEINRWNRNNNTMTIRDFLALDCQAQNEILNRVRKLPSHVEITVSGKQFYLVHGFPADNLEDEIWNRPEIDTPAPIPGVQVIIGHTPVCCLSRTEEEEEAYIKEIEEQGEYLQIVHAPGFIDIDCGCGYDIAVKALACLRLEDMKEFYVW